MFSITRYAVGQKIYFYRPLYNQTIRYNASKNKMEPGQCIDPLHPCPKPEPPREEEDVQTTIKMQLIPYQTPPVEDHDAFNMRINRPQSPHLSIYAYQLTSSLSITHRITGAIIGFYTTLFSVTTLFMPCGIEYYVDTLDVCNISCSLMFILKMFVALPFTYHFWNGIRHLVWDTANCLTLKGVYYSGYSMLAAAGISAIVLACM